MSAPRQPQHERSRPDLPPGEPETPLAARPPARRRTLPGTVAAVLSLAIGVIYLVNPTAGVLELIPDVMPFVGNLDEATAMGLVTWGLSYFGIEIFRARR